MLQASIESDQNVISYVAPRRRGPKFEKIKIEDKMFVDP